MKRGQSTNVKEYYKRKITMLVRGGRVCVNEIKMNVKKCKANR